MRYGQKRGQMSAPIELFIAVIIMSLSMGLAFYLYGNISDTQCEYRLKTQNERLQAAMVIVSNGGWDSSSPLIDYTMERCSARSVEAVRLIHYTQPQYCRICSGNYGGGCWLIEPLTYTTDSSGEGILGTLKDATVCVELSEVLQLNIIHSPDCNGKVSEKVCPTSVQGKVIDDATCEKLSYAKQGAYDDAMFATIERSTQGNSAFKIRITKSGTTGNVAGTAGQLDLCVSQVT